jgi:hypothetical protein
MVPITGWGKAIATVAFFLGIMLLAIPISVVTGYLNTGKLLAK